MNPCWVSQPVPAMGAIKAEGIKNQLGRPKHERLTVFVREAVQNSWDAGDRRRHGPVHFGLDLRLLDAETAQNWRRILGASAPRPDDLPLLPSLDREEISILFVSDRGTTGLGGPTRADKAVPNEPHDYVSFVLNVGDPRDTEYGGGTYGYGKAVFFRASAADTIVIHTHCVDEHGRTESRLVGCALGTGFDLDGCAYTGRHWFGIPGEGDIVEPIRGDEADRLAAELGFPHLEVGELGTTIGVLAPSFDGHDPDEVMRLLADSIIWHLWPKMVTRDGAAPAMSFRLTRDGEAYPIPDPVSHPVIRLFVRAFRELDERGETIPYGPGAVPIGRIRLCTTFDPPPHVDEVGQAAGLGQGIRHCCLLRVPDLVVDYRQGPPLPDERIWYAGVFRTFPEQDEIFAQAEPPTHDSWSPEDIDNPGRSIVRTTLRKIDDCLREHATPDRSGAGPPDAASDGLASLSRFLGGLLVPAPAGGAGPRTGGGGNGKPGARTPVRMLGAPRWDEHDGQPVLVQEFEVDPGRVVTVEAEATVRVWGGNETEPPIGASIPHLLGWRRPDGSFDPSPRVAIPRGGDGGWQAIVSSPPDTVARIRVREAKDRTVDG